METGSVLRSCAAALLIFSGPALCAQTIRVTRTTSDLSSALAAAPSLEFAAARASSLPSITVDETQRYQTMDGFGASISDGSAWLLYEKLTAAARLRVMTELFDPVHGAGLSFLRQPIGSSDLSRSAYTFDDMPAGEQDPGLQRFSTQHDDAYVFPVLREALRLNPAITVMATPWSPPAWMKTRPTTFGGSLREDAMVAYAAYLTRSLQAFAAAGIPVKYLSVQNEPLYETQDYPGTLMTASQQKRLIGNDLGPDLKRAGLTAQVLAYDHNWDHPEYPIEVASDAVAAPFVAGAAMHCYGGDVSAQEQIHLRLPDKGIWLTECSGGTWQKQAPLLATAHLLIEATRHWGKSVVLWAVATDSDHGPHQGGCATCRGLVTVDLHTSPATVTYNGDFYALAQASRFVQPGATRIGSNGLDAQGLESVAFQNTNTSISLLVLNDGARAESFQIVWHGRRAGASLLPGEFVTYQWMPAE